MPEHTELEAFRSLTQARDSQNPRAELEALRDLQSILSQKKVDPPAFGQRAAARFVSNALGFPSGIGKLLEIGSAGAQAAVGEAGEFLGGQDVPIGERFSKAREQQSQLFPGRLASTLQNIPSPSTEEVLAAVETIKRLPQGNIRSQFESQLERMQAAAEQNPVRTTVEDVVGDIGTLVAGRPATSRLFPAARAKPAASREVVDLIDSAANRISRATGFAKRLGSQAGEAGFEGALLAAMGDGDPLATAGWAAGSQMGGSLALQGTRAFAKYPWRTLGGLALGHWILRALGPGNQGALEDVRDETIQTMLTTFGLGAVGALAGAGRLSPGRTAGRDRFIDALDTIRRAPLQSIVNQLSEDETARQVVGRIVENPNSFGQEVRNRLERAARSDRPNALIKEVESLMNNPNFRRRLEGN